MTTKVLIISPAELPMPNVKGGAIETLTTYLLKENEVANSNIEFLVICMYDSQAKREASYYKHTRFLFYTKNVFSYFYDFYWRVLRKIFPNQVCKHWGRISRFRREISRFSPDFVIVEGNCHQIDHAKKIGVPVVLHLHTDLINKETKDVQGIIQSRPTYWVISNFLRHRIEEVGGDRIEIFRNSIDTELFTTKSNIDVRKELGIPISERILLYCGRVVPIKGVMELVVAFHKAKEENLSLLIVGGSNFADSELSEYEKKLHDYIKRYSLNVRFTGYVAPCLLPAYYQAADFFAYPSICNEAAGLGIVEATCSGLSVITSNMGGIPEYIKKDRTIVVNKDENYIDGLARAIHLQCSDPRYKKQALNENDDYVFEHSLKTYYNNFCELANKLVQ